MDRDARREDDDLDKQTQITLDVPAGPSPSTPHPKQKPSFWKSIDWKLMLALVLPVVLETLDYTVVATAQTRIASAFNALSLQSYIGTSYLLASTVFLPFFACVADVYGRHFGLQVSLLLFLAGSALSTGAINMPMMLVGRGIAGVGAAGLLTIVRTLLSDSASLDQNNIQQSMMFFLYFVGYSIGPITGGYLVAASFRWVFAINLPCTAFAMILCFVFLHNRSSARGPNVDGDELDTATPSPSPSVGTWLSKLALIDWVGTFLFVTGGVLSLLALNWGPTDNWKSARVIVNIVLGVLLIVLCLAWEVLLERRSPASSLNRTSTSPPSHIHTRYTGVFSARQMIPIEMLTSYDMCVAQYDAFIAGVVMFVMFYFVALFATMVTGLPASQAGIQLLYFSPGLGGGSLTSIWLIKVYRQPKFPIVLGNVIMTVGVGLIQMAIQRNIPSQVNGFMAMVGVGVGMTAGPLVIHARFTKPNHVAIANAMLLFFRALGGTIGLAQCFTVLNAKVNSYVSTQLVSLAESGALSASDIAALAALFANGGLSSITSLDGLSSGVQDVVRGAFSDGVRWSFVSLLPWLGIGCLVSLFMSRIEDTDEIKEGGERALARVKPRNSGGDHDVEADAVITAP